MRKIVNAVSGLAFLWFFGGLIFGIGDWVFLGVNDYPDPNGLRWVILATMTVLFGMAFVLLNMDKLSE